MPKTAIITCTRLTSDRLPYLAAAWASLQVQTQQDFQWFVVLDGAVNEAPAFLFEDSRIRVITSLNHLGAGPARSRALEQTRTKYICTLDDDDVLTPDSLVLREAFLDSRPDVGWVGAHMSDMAPDGTPNENRWEQPARAGEYAPGDLLDIWDDPAGWFVALSHTFLTRTELVREVGGWQTGTLQDIGVIARVSEICPGAIIDDVVYRWRKHRGQVTSRVEGVERIAMARHIWKGARALGREYAAA